MTEEDNVHADLFELFETLETCEDPKARLRMCFRAWSQGFDRLHQAQRDGDPPTWADVWLARLVGLADAELQATFGGDVHKLEQYESQLAALQDGAAKSRPTEAEQKRRFEEITADIALYKQQETTRSGRTPSTTEAIQRLSPRVAQSTYFRYKRKFGNPEK